MLQRVIIGLVLTTYINKENTMTAADLVNLLDSLKEFSIYVIEEDGAYLRALQPRR